MHDAVRPLIERCDHVERFSSLAEGRFDLVAVASQHFDHGRCFFLSACQRLQAIGGLSIRSGKHLEKIFRGRIADDVCERLQGLAHLAAELARRELSDNVRAHRQRFLIGQHQLPG